jgi:hypothetical protein
MSQEITAAVEYLKERGHRIGDAFVPVDGKIHIWIDDKACAYEHVRALAALERMKEASQTIGSLALKRLAVICRRVAETGQVDEQVVSEANALVHQWGILVQSATPQPTSLQEAKSIDAQGQALAGRMVDFLATQLPLISN